MDVSFIHFRLIKMISLQYKTAKNKDKNTIVVNDIPSIDPTYLSLTIPAINFEKMRLAGGRWWEGGATKFNVSSRLGFKL